MYPSSEYLFNDSRSLQVQRFKKLSTLKSAYFHVFLNVFFELLSICLCLRMTLLSPWNDLSSLIFCQAFFWVMSLGFHHTYSTRHWALKLSGHFSLYEKLENCTLVLFSIPTFFNVIILIIQGVSYKYSSLNSNFLELAHIVTGAVIILEVLATIPVIICYIVYVHKYNRLKPVPDTEQYEYSLPCDGRSASEVGYRLNGEAVADFLEKQSDLIYYLKSTIAEMCNKLPNHS